MLIVTNTSFELSVIILNVVMLNVVMLNVVMLNVVAPSLYIQLLNLKSMQGFQLCWEKNYNFFALN